ncbi:Hypothetical protein A7982_05419 [Minicystis rosea]|nr:Hypothetical protein A7982_05419 [Minicystis rosea]
MLLPNMEPGARNGMRPGDIPGAGHARKPKERVSWRASEARSSRPGADGVLHRL